MPHYYASKIAQEQAALEAGEREGLAVVLALPSVVLGGPYVQLGPSNAIVLRYLLDATRSTYPGGANVVDARNVGTGHVQLLESGRAGQRYVLGGENVTWRTLHALVGQLAGLPGPYATAPASLTWAVSAVAEAWARVTDTVPLSSRRKPSPWVATTGTRPLRPDTSATSRGQRARPWPARWPGWPRVRSCRGGSGSRSGWLRRSGRRDHCFRGHCSSEVGWCAAGLAQRVTSMPSSTVAWSPPLITTVPL